MINEFDIEQYLLHQGFKRSDVDNRVFEREEPRTKVKLIQPDSQFLCGYHYMAVTFPTRIHAKMEKEIPNTKDKADRIFLPLMEPRPLRDSTYDNTFETQGRVVNKSLNVLSYNIKGASALIISFVKPGIDNMLRDIKEGDWVHVVLKVNGSGALNTIETISIQKV